MWTIFVILYWIYFSWLNRVSGMFPANNGLRLQWIHCGRCNVSWFQALLVRLAGELTEIQDKRWRPPRRTDPCRTLLVLQAMSYKEPLISIYSSWNLQNQEHLSCCNTPSNDFFFVRPSVRNLRACRSSRWLYTISGHEYTEQGRYQLRREHTVYRW